MTRRPKAEITEQQVPLGARSITRTTTERFTKVDDGDQGEDSRAEQKSGDEPDVPLELESFVEDEEPKSALDSVLASLKGIGEITIYVIRKPDPMGLTFANPCNMSHTAGDLPFDETFTSKEAIELAVQSVYGGGKFQLQIRQNGDYVTAWTTLIADPRKREQPAASPQPQYAQAVETQPRQTAREELLDVLDLAERIAGMRNNNPSAAPSLPPAPPPDPMEVVSKSFDLFKNMRDAVGEIVPAGGQRNWVDSAATLADKLRIGDLIFSVGSMVSQAVIQQRAMDAAAAANGKNADARTAPTQAAPSEANSAQTSASQAVLLPGGPSSVVGADESATAAQASSATPDLSPEVVPQPSPEEMEVLEYLVEQLRLYEQEESTETYDAYIQRVAAKCKTLPPERLALVESMPPLIVLFYLMQLRADWADVASLRCGTEFITDVKEALADDAALEAMLSEGSVIQPAAETTARTNIGLVPPVPEATKPRKGSDK